MSGALLNLVRLNTADTTDPLHDYTVGELYERHEEIKLVDPDGDPCAIPMPAKFTNMDYPYRFITGSTGAQGRIISRDLTIGVDFLDNEVSRRLEKWMQQRARVLFSPNFGRNTVFSYRPRGLFGTVIPSDPDVPGIFAYDLTGNHRIQCLGFEWPIMWDEQQRRFVKHSYWTDGEVSGFLHGRYHQTKGGAAHGSPRSCLNLMQVPYPESATSGFVPGTIGWLASGADSSQLTFVYNAAGFGHADCPASVTVSYPATASSARSMIVPAFTVTPSGSGNTVLTLWLKGQMPDAAKLQIIGPTGTTEEDLSGKRFEGWAPVTLSRNEASWSTMVVVLVLNSDDPLAGSFEIGPTMVAQKANTLKSVGPYWTDNDTESDMELIQTYSDFEFPGQGSLVLSFMLPKNHGSSNWELPVYGLIGTDNWGIAAGVNSSGAEFIQVSETGGSAYSALLSTVGAAYRAGEINTVAYVWFGESQKLYVNGVLVATIDRSTYSIDFGALDNLRLGWFTGGFGIYPGLMLTARVDEGAYTDTDVANIHYALTDPVALQAAANARGRVYQITSIPQTLRTSAGGSHVLGNIVLKQVDYQEWQADPLNTEEVIR